MVTLPPDGKESKRFLVVVVIILALMYLVADKVFSALGL